MTKKGQVLARIQEIGVLPSIRVASAEEALFAAEEILDCGIEVVEITMTVPNGVSVISELTKANPDLIVGAGTVLDLRTARECISAGAAYVSSPGFNLAITEFTVAHDVCSIPGVLTASEVMADNCLGLAAQLAYYFFLALFPALLFLVALASFFPLGNVVDTVTATLARVAPGEVLQIIQDQILKIAHSKSGGLLTLGMLGTIWSTSSGVDAIIDTLNQAYDIQEGRPWWRVKLTALALTVGLALFVIVATILVVAGPELAEHVANWAHLGREFAWTWKIVQWPLVFILISLYLPIFSLGAGSSAAG